MKNLLPALAALTVLYASAPAFAATPSHGSTVPIPPLIVKDAAASKSTRPLIVTLPTQAGNVSKMVATNLLAKGPSWIAKGEHYYSLCVPNRRMVACAPIVATSVMNDIEVGALVAKDGTPRLTFKIAPSAKPRRALYAINYFLVRTKKQVVHFNRMAVSYAPAPRQNALQVGATSNLEIGGGGSCSYDDDSSYDCIGGDSGGSGDYQGDSGGYQGNENDYDPIPGAGSLPNEPAPNAPTGQCEGNCNYPSSDNGDADPCIGPDGIRICNSPNEIPQVPINEQRPAPEEPMSMPTCSAVGPFTIECGRLPPVVGGEPQELPRGQSPWFPQSWCNFSWILCSAAQEPDNERGIDTSTSGKSMDQLYDICDAIATVEYDVCSANRAAGADNRTYRACNSKVETRRSACYTTARELTDNGSHLAP